MFHEDVHNVMYALTRTYHKSSAGMAKEMGAHVVMLADDRVTHIVTFTEDNQTFLNVKSHGKDVIKVSWLYDCYDLAQRSDGDEPAIPLQPKYMAHMTPETEKEFDGKFDQFGDSYLDKMSELDMATALVSHDSVWLAESSKPQNFISRRQMQDLDAELAVCDIQEAEEVMVLHREDATCSESDSDSGIASPKDGHDHDDDLMSRKSTEIANVQAPGQWRKGHVFACVPHKRQYVVSCEESDRKRARHTVSFKDIKHADVSRGRLWEPIWSIFSGYKMLMVDLSDVNDLTHVSRLKLASGCLIAGGGEEVTMSNQHEKTHVVVESAEIGSEEVSRLLKQRHVRFDGSTVQVVTMDWIVDSFNEGRVLLDDEGAVQDRYVVYV
jgi:hypothetical protein